MLPLALLLLVPMQAEPKADDPAARVFELRTYHTHPGRLGALNDRFRDHTIPLFKKHGMQPIGFWTPAEGTEAADSTLVYLLEFPSREAAEQSWAAFRSDPEWQEAKSASEADGPIVERVESVFLEPTDYGPDPAKLESTAQTPHAFELRTYHASPGKLDDLNTRFREHTIEIFKTHGMESVGYWTPADEDDGRDSTLVYMIAHKSRDAAAGSWKEFGADPKWQAVYKASQPDGVPLAAEVESVYLVPTDYSPLK